MQNCRVLTEKITESKTKHLLVQNELNKLKTFRVILLERVILKKVYKII